jgi:hypothetical protein
MTDIGAVLLLANRGISLKEPSSFLAGESGLRKMTPATELLQTLRQLRR